MSFDSERAEEYADVVIYLFSLVIVVYFWYLNDLYLNWIVVVVGVGAGIVVYLFRSQINEYSVKGFILTMTLVFVMLVAIYSRSLVAGVVSAVVALGLLEVREICGSDSTEQATE